MTSSITRFGITWVFKNPVNSGLFCNGDPWVVGPVEIIRIDNSQASMLNPVPGQIQGFYQNGAVTNPENSPKYDVAKNVNTRFPATIQEGSLVSVTYNPETWAGNPPEKTWFKEVAILTVVKTTPPAGSFRPAYAGNADKKLWNENELSYAPFKKLQAPVAANVPNPAWVAKAIERPLLEMHYNYINSYWKGSFAETKPGGYPRRTYGREIANIGNSVGLWLQLNKTDAEKKNILILMVQWGIDVYGLLQAGMQWQPNGGHNHGRLMPLYIAAKALNSKEMLAKCDAAVSPFQEFAQHWFVSAADVATPRADGKIAPYTAAHVGMPEWNSGGPSERNKASSDWNATGYRFINGAPNSTLVATILLMGGRGEVKCEALFEYITKRYYPASKGGAQHTLPAYGDSISLFTRDMWETYISKTIVPPVTPPVVEPPVVVPTDNFKIGDTIKVFRQTNVRGTGALNGTLLGTQGATNKGKIVEGPVIADNIKWWKVDYENGVDGWSGGDNFELSEPTPPVVEPPVIPPPVAKQRYINILQTDDKITYTSIAKIPFPKVKGRTYKTVFLTE